MLPQCLDSRCVRNPRREFVLESLEKIVKEFLMVIAPVFLLLVSEGCRAAPRLPAIVAHRGASEDAPENTLASFRLGFDQGADRIEGDFRMTSDGHIVAMHDSDLARTTGDARVVAEVTLEEIRSLDAGSWGGWDRRGFAGEPVPTLEQVLSIVPEGRGILVEVKDTARIVDPLVAVLEESDLDPKQITIISFEEDVVERFKRIAPDRRAFWLTSFREGTEGWRPSVEEVIETANRIGADGVDVRATPEVVDESFAKAIRDAGLELHVWTVNDPGLARRMVEVGVDSITTDRPARILEETSR